MGREFGVLNRLGWEGYPYLASQLGRMLHFAHQFPVVVVVVAGNVGQRGQNHRKNDTEYMGTVCECDLCRRNYCRFVVGLNE